MAGGGIAQPSPQAQTGFGSATQTAVNPQAQGGMGGGGGAANYDPSATGNSGIFGNAAPAPGQMNMQLTDAQKASLLAQQQAQRQPAPQPAPAQLSPFVQQQMMQQRAPQQVSGLQAALLQMLGQYNQPMARPQMQQAMPQYQNQALQYRPNIGIAQQNLSRVAPSVEVQKRKAEAELAAMDPMARALRSVGHFSSMLEEQAGG